MVFKTIDVYQRFIYIDNLACSLFQSLLAEENNILPIHYRQHWKFLMFEYKEIVRVRSKLGKLVLRRAMGTLSSSDKAFIILAAGMDFPAHHQILNDLANQIAYKKYKEYINVLAGEVSKDPLKISYLQNAMKRGYVAIAIESALDKKGKLCTERWSKLATLFGYWTPLDRSGNLLSLFIREGVDPDIDDDEEPKELPSHIIRQLALSAFETTARAAVVSKKEAKASFRKRLLREKSVNTVNILPLMKKAKQRANLVKQLETGVPPKLAILKKLFIRKLEQSFNGNRPIKRGSFVV
jgi:hypothetical protein